MARLDDNHVAAKYRLAASTFPETTVSVERFAAAVAAAVAAGAESVDELHTNDLYLALACLENDPRAVTMLESQVFTVIRPSLERVCRDGNTSVDDVMQWTREKLLVGGDTAPRLAQYTGRGSLVGWVRVVAVREALQERRKSKREHDHDHTAMLEGGAPDIDVELMLLRERYAASFRSAVEAALRSLTPEQRTLLRFHTCDRLTIDQLAPMLGVHRATAARRLEKARADALEHTRRLVRERHGLSESEARSLCTALGREVDVSIGRALEEGDT
jgi:RNA polymerase sigma-70 factor (ECF subfamily)